MKERPNILPALLLFISGLPIVIYFVFAWQYCVNLPSWDDYDFLESIIKFLETDNLEEKLSILFQKHVESRMAFIRIVFLSSLALLGKIDIKFILFISNAALLGLLFIFFKNHAPFNNKLFFSLPVVLLLFQLQNWQNMMWIAATNHYFALYFSGAAFFWLSRKSSKDFSLAFLHSFIAPFTLGAGLGAPILGALYLILVKRMKEAVIWITGGGLLFIFYFYNYETFNQKHDLATLLESSGQHFLYFFSFLGSIFAFKSFEASIVLGIFCFLYFIFLTINKYYLKNPFIYLFTAWIILSALIASFFRSEIGFDQSLSYRYKIYSSSFLIMVYLSITDIISCTDKLKRSIVTGVIAVTSILYVFAAIDAQPKMEFQKKLLYFRTNHWLTHNHSLFFYNQAEANQTLVSSIQSKVYKLPKDVFSISEEFISQRISSYKTCQKDKERLISAGFNGIEISLQKGLRLFRLEGVVRSLEDKFSTSDDIIIILKSGTERILFSSRPQEKPEMSIHFHQNSFNNGFLGLIPLEELNKDRYQIGLCYKNQVTFYNKFIDQTRSFVIEN